MRADTTLQEIAWIYPEDLITLSWCLVLRLLRSRRAKRGRFPTLTACWNKSGMRIWTCWNETRSNQAGSNMKWSEAISSRTHLHRSQDIRRIFVLENQKISTKDTEIWVGPYGATRHMVVRAFPDSISWKICKDSWSKWRHPQTSCWVYRTTWYCCLLLNHVKRNHPGLCKWKALLSNACQASGS
jgi:hypothetical protein